MRFFEAFVDEMSKIAQVAGTQQAGMPPMPMFKKAPLMTSGAQIQLGQARKQMAFAPTGLPTGQAPAAQRTR